MLIPPYLGASYQRDLLLVTLASMYMSKDVFGAVMNGTVPTSRVQLLSAGMRESAWPVCVAPASCDLALRGSPSSFCSSRFSTQTCLPPAKTVAFLFSKLRSLFFVSCCGGWDFHCDAE